jgi:hypothetical protein
VGKGHVIRNKDLLASETRAAVRVQGYDGKSSLATTLGHVPGVGTAVVVNGAPNNLLNLRKLVKDIGGTYSGDADKMVIYDREGQVYAVAEDHGDGFLSFKYSSVKNYNHIRANLIVANDFESHQFSQEEITRAKEAYQLCARLKHPGTKSLKRSLDNGDFPGCHLTSKDVDNAEVLFGKCLGCLEGKMKSQRQVTSQTKPASKIGENVFVDIVAFAKGVVAIGGYIGLIFAVDEKSSYVTVVGIKSKKDVGDALLTLLAVYNGHGHRIQNIIGDGESSIVTHNTLLSRYGVKVVPTPAGLHNKRAERYIQTFKQRRNAVKCGLSYKLPDVLEMELSIAVAQGMNDTATSVSGKQSPTILFTGKKPVIPKHPFGQPGIFYHPSPDVKGEHGEWGIYLGLRDSQHQNNIRGYMPSRGTICSRMRFEPTTVVPKEWGFESRIPAAQKRGAKKQATPPVHLEPPRMEHEAVAAPAIPTPITDVQTGEVLPAVPPVPTDAATNHGVVQPQVASPVIPASGVTSQATLPAVQPQPKSQSQEGESAITVPKDQEGARGRHGKVTFRTEPAVDASVPLSKDQVKVSQPAKPEPAKKKPAAAKKQPLPKPAEAVPAPVPKPVPEPIPTTTASGRPLRRAATKSHLDGPARLRDNDQQASQAIVLEQPGDHPWLKAYRVSFNSAMKDPDKERREQTLEAARKEIITLMDDHKALRAVKYADIPKEQHRFIINGHMFFKDQYNADGSFKRRKGRLVMNGNEENPFDLGETRAPTVNPISLMTTLAISGNDPQIQNDAYDIDGAFICTEMVDGKTVIVRIGGKLAELMVKIYPWLDDYMGGGSCLYFYLERFLYGLAEAARAFNQKLDKVLRTIGFEKTVADECLYVKVWKGGKRHIICVHVDDLYSAAPDREAAKEFERDLQKHFKIKSQHGTVSYLGMVITKDPKTGVVKVNQKGYVAEMLERFDVTEKVVKVPARPNLMDGDDKSEILQNKKEYISMVMSLMYVARLTRPDILMPVTYLATKCQQPRRADYINARWVLRYLKGTRDYGLRFGKSDLVLRFHADASYLSHSDGKGHTGFLALVGGTVILARSVKQKLTSRSSTEAEIIAAEECATYLVFMRQLCKDLGIACTEPTMLAQDNRSAIIIVTQGGTFKRTKHMVGRIGFLKDQVEQRNAWLKYTPTKQMLADMLTKPVPKNTIRSHLKALGITA